MSDIVDRLRRTAECDCREVARDMCFEANDGFVWAYLMDEAALEIERLTTENAELRSGEYLVKVVEERESLRRYIEESPSPQTHLEVELGQAICLIKDAFEDAGVEVGVTFARRLASEIMLLAASPQPTIEGGDDA